MTTKNPKTTFRLASEMLGMEGMVECSTWEKVSRGRGGRDIVMVGVVGMVGMGSCGGSYWWWWKGRKERGCVVNGVCVRPNSAEVADQCSA